MKDQKAANEQLITGILLASQFDLEGNITSLAVYANTEDIYEVIQKPLDRNLFNLIQMRVRVNGKIQRYLDGRCGVKIKSIELVDEDHDNSFFIKNR